jgi:hypothetical protein
MLLQSHYFLVQRCTSSRMPSAGCQVKVARARHLSAVGCQEDDNFLGYSSVAQTDSSTTRQVRAAWRTATHLEFSYRSLSTTAHRRMDTPSTERILPEGFLQSASVCHVTLHLMVWCCASQLCCLEWCMVYILSTALPVLVQVLLPCSLSLRPWTLPQDVSPFTPTFIATQMQMLTVALNTLPWMEWNDTAEASVFANPRKLWHYSSCCIFKTKKGTHGRISREWWRSGQEQLWPLQHLPGGGLRKATRKRILNRQSN